MTYDPEGPGLKTQPRVSQPGMRLILSPKGQRSRSQRLSACVRLQRHRTLLTFARCRDHILLLNIAADAIQPVGLRVWLGPTLTVSQFCLVWRGTSIVTLTLPQLNPDVTWSGLPPNSNVFSVAHIMPPFRQIL